MERHRLTRSGLADVLGVNRSTLSRFLNQSVGYAPANNRPKMLRILERIEAFCHRRNIRHLLDLEARERAEGTSEEEVWFGNFMRRLVYLEEELEPVTALTLLPELSAQARAAPSPYGASMGTNLLLRIAGVMDRPEASDASPDLLRETADRVYRLEESVLETASEGFRKTILHRPIAFAGYSLAMIGMLLADDSLLEHGIERLVRAAGMPHERGDYHWENLLIVLERLFETRHVRAKHWSAIVASQVPGDPPEALTHALEARSFAKLLDHWRQATPDLAKRLPHDGGGT